MASGSPRRPRGYLGKNHETRGSDILAVRQSLERLVAEQSTPNLPVQILGADHIDRLAAVEADGWYPIEWLLTLMDRVDAKLGRYGLMKMGRVLFSMTHAERSANDAKSGYDIVYGLDTMYRYANRGEEIGGWKVLRFDAARAEIDKTTPHHCAMEEGLLAQALASVGAPAVVTQSACFRTGAPSCRFELLPRDGGPTWMGAHH